MLGQALDNQSVDSAFNGEGEPGDAGTPKFAAGRRLVSATMRLGQSQKFGGVTIYERYPHAVLKLPSNERDSLGRGAPVLLLVDLPPLNDRVWAEQCCETASSDAAAIGRSLDMEALRTALGSWTPGKARWSRTWLQRIWLRWQHWLAVHFGRPSDGSIESGDHDDLVS